MAFTYVTITHTFETAADIAAAGTVDFTPIAPMHNGITVVQKKVSATLSNTGALSQPLAANTDPDTTPTGTVYQVVERITGQPIVTYYIQVPHNQGGSINLRELAGWQGGTGAPSGVVSVNGEPPDGLGNVLLSATDIGAQPADGDLTGLAALADGVPIRDAGTWGLVSGTRDGTKFLRDDGTWQAAPGGTPYTSENARDDIATALVAGSNITITPNDGADTITISAATSGSSGIPASTVDAKGDLIAGTANDTVARRSVGANGQALLADSAQTTGLAWGAPTPAAHTHSGADLTSGTVATARLGSGTANSTTFLRGDNTWATPPGGSGGTSGLAPAVCLVVSNDMPSSFKTAAAGIGGQVFVCDGTNDQVEIQSAINLAAALQSRNADQPAGAQQWGVVQLTGGRFNIASAIQCRTAVRLTGAGWLTELRAVSCNSAGLLTLAGINEHLIQVDNLYLYGNYSSGGSCSAIHFDMTGSTNAGVATYPSSNPDCYHKLCDLYIDGFTSTSGRNGIKLFCSSTANQRGWLIDRIQMRNIANNGIDLTSSSDGIISNVHMGTIGNSGFLVTTANVRMTNNKAFYCDNWALDWQSNQGTCVAFEAQDSLKGVHANASQSTLDGIIIDTCQDEGLLVNASRQVITGLGVMKAASRYSTMTYGVRYLSSADCMIMGMVGNSNITNRTSGSPGSGVFARITGNGSVIATG